MFDAGTERAIRAALAAHAGQTRKGDAVAPYATHPLHVALILARLGSSPRVVQVALLHDIVEDCAGWSAARVEQEFGADVASIVAELSEDKSQSWQERKQAQVDHAPHLSSDALSVKAADKLHNLRTLVDDLCAAADQGTVWRRFTGGRERTLSMSRALVDALALRCDVRLAAALRDALEDLERTAARGLS